MLAVGRGQLEAARTLLLAQADVATVDKQGWSCLHRAASFGRTPVLKLLLAAGAAVDAAAADGRTPLHLAAAAGHVEAVRALVQAGADPSAPSTAGCTPLHTAAARGQLMATRALLQAAGPAGSPQLQACLGAQAASEGTALHCAARCGAVAVVRALLQAGAAAGVRGGPAGDSPLHALARGWQADRADQFLATARALLAAPGVEPAAVNSREETPRALAEAAGASQLAELPLGPAGEGSKQLRQVALTGAWLAAALGG